MRRPFSAGSLFWGAAAGAVAMYLLDPDHGRRRRAMIGERARRGQRRLTQRASTLGESLRGDLSALRATLPKPRIPGDEGPLS